MKPIVWHLKDLAYILRERQKNQFDGNIGVSGDRGNGKSTLALKLFLTLKGFNQQKSQVYAREDVIRLLQNEKYGYCFDDEAVNSGYKRDFQSKAQQELIKIITAYRDNYNIYASAIPNFFSLDKDLRDLIFLHLFVIERGIAVVHMPLQGLMYSQDRWDAKNNAIIERGWVQKMKTNPDWKIPFHKLSTFKGYLFFGDLTPKQREVYLQIKRDKRHEAMSNILDNADKDKEATFEQRIMSLLLEGKITEEGLLQLCLMEDKKMSSVKGRISIMLKDSGDKRTVTELLQQKHDTEVLEKKQVIKDLVPSFNNP